MAKQHSRQADDNQTRESAAKKILSIPKAIRNAAEFIVVAVSLGD
jgi:hypothetical protein